MKDQLDITLTPNPAGGWHVAVQGREPPPIGRLAVGRDGAAVVALLPRIFSLCAQAQAAALTLALAAAKGTVADVDPAPILAERAAEALRGLVLALASPAALPALAPALRCVQSGELERGLALLGLSPGCLADPDWPNGPAPLARLVATIPTAPAHTVDGLLPADDTAIGAALLAGGEGFARLPSLPGRCPETGALVRHQNHAWLAATGGAAARFLARLIDIRCCADALAGGPVPVDLLALYPLAPRTGLGVVECARGRLYHLVRLDDQDRLAQLILLAPTEWNFHPRGPLAQALTITADAGKLVAAFDPCVGVAMTVRESADA